MWNGVNWTSASTPMKPDTDAITASYPTSRRPPSCRVLDVAATYPSALEAQAGQWVVEGEAEPLSGRIWAGSGRNPG